MINRYLSRAWPLRSAWLGGCAGWLRLRIVASVRDLRNRRSLPIGARPLALHLILGRANTIQYRRSLDPCETRFSPGRDLRDRSSLPTGAGHSLAPWTSRRYRPTI